MGIRMIRPDEATLRPLLATGRGQQLTYEPVGVTAPGADVPHGFRRDRWVRELGGGDEVFSRLRESVLSWGIQRGSGLVVVADAGAAVGSTVAMSAPLPIGHIDVVCRVVDVIDAQDRCGFVYGTLPTHPERGEESFIIIRDADERVSIEIVAVWRLRHWLGRVLPLAARILQRRATERYLAAAERIVTGLADTE